MTAELLIALVMLATLVIYALFAGADFGGGIWDLMSRGPRAREQRARIAEAIGPVWEANHVWLIFLIVLLFTCFPRAYAAVSVALFWPLHLVLVGVVLRGASFVFRAYGAHGATAQAAWGHIFGIASGLTPMLLGMCLAAVSTGDIRIVNGEVTAASAGAWLSLFAIITGVLALLICAYLAAIYLAFETRDALQEDFRRRALVVWFVAGIASLLTLVAAYATAPRVWTGLISTPANVWLLAGSLSAPLSLIALLRRHYYLARIFGATQVIALLLGWAAAHVPYLIYPDLTMSNSAAPQATLTFTAWTLPFGLALLVPSLWYLFSVFKARNPAAAATVRRA